MQSSNKAPKKTKIADETTASAPEVSAAAERTSKPRTSKSSTSKKDAGESGPARHRKASLPETNTESTPAVKTMAAAAASSPTASTAHVQESAPSREASREEIAKLAYSYWAARGFANGSAEQDWLRAESELRAKR